MSEGWQLRPAGLEDLPAVVKIFLAEDLAYRGRSEVEVEASSEQITADPTFEIARDLSVAEAGGQIIAAAIVNPHALGLAVHPDHDLVGIRASLLAWGQRRQRELGRPLRVDISAAKRPTVDLLRADGYRLERFYVEMARDFTVTGPPEPGALPLGYRMRPIDPVRDVVALHALDERAFRGRPDYQPETLESYDKRHISFSRFVPRWSRLIETAAEQPSGSLVGFRRPDRSHGYVAVLAVDPAHRRRGLARALLLASFAEMYDAGLSGAELHVASDNDRALDLYTGVGMRAGERFEHYVRDAR